MRFASPLRFPLPTGRIKILEKQKAQTIKPTWPAKAGWEVKKMIKPLGNRIVVKPQVREISKVILVTNREPFNEGTVVAIGPEVYDVDVGAFIKFGNGDYQDWPIHKVDGEEFQIITEADVAVVVEEV
jgi:co-chaperonin GroES (HSP10)